MPEEKPAKPVRKRSPAKKRPEAPTTPETRSYEATPPPTPRKNPAPRRAPARKTAIAAAPAAKVEAAVQVSDPLSVLMVTSEAHPFAKTGGLAEVSASLTDALGQLGHSVTLVLPRYRGIAVARSEKPQT